LRLCADGLLSKLHCQRGCCARCAAA